MTKLAEAVVAVFAAVAMFISVPIYALVSFIQTQRHHRAGVH